jgi:hypothetical protein
MRTLSAVIAIVLALGSSAAWAGGKSGGTQSGSAVGNPSGAARGTYNVHRQYRYGYRYY